MQSGRCQRREEHRAAVLRGARCHDAAHKLDRASARPRLTDEERAELRTEVRTEFANVNTAIAKLAEQHARTETHRLRWTLGAIVTGSALGVAILRLLDG